MTRRLLVVCTANVCRSPVAERLLRGALDGVVDPEGHDWIVASAGTGRFRAEIDPNTVAAAARVGVDLTGHVARTLDRQVLAEDGADLVLTMAREHLPRVVDVDPGAWPRTFTLKELVRRGRLVRDRAAIDSFVGWRERVAEGRRAADLLRPDPADDVADPYGLPLAHHATMAAELSALVTELVHVGPWSQVGA